MCCIKYKIKLEKCRSLRRVGIQKRVSKWIDSLVMRQLFLSLSRTELMKQSVVSWKASAFVACIRPVRSYRIYQLAIQRDDIMQTRYVLECFVVPEIKNVPPPKT